MVQYFFLVVLGLVCLPRRSAFQPVQNLGNLYNKLAQQEDPSRNPVIVIFGILGSRLEVGSTGEVVWGAFGSEAVDPMTAEGAVRPGRLEVSWHSPGTECLLQHSAHARRRRVPRPANSREPGGGIWEPAFYLFPICL